jgi:biopolymer transport protein ExbD
VSGAVGISLMILAAATEWQKIGDAPIRDCPLTQPGSRPAPEPRRPARGRDSFMTLRRHPRRRDFGLSFFALCAAFISELTMLGVVVIKAMDGRSSQGLPVRLPKLGVVATPLPGVEPVLVALRLTEHSLRPEVYVNSQPVQWDDLDSVLRKQLSIRPPNWPVYLEGDPKMDFGWAAKAIEVIRGSHAEVMLVVGR